MDSRRLRWAREIAAVSLLLAAGLSCELLAPADGLTGGSSPPPPGDGGDDAADVHAIPDVKTGDGPTVHDALSEPPPLGPESYRRSIDVAAADSLVLHYVVSFTLDTSTLVAQGKVRPDLSDLRIFDLNGTQIDRVVEPSGPSSSSKVSFAVSSAIGAHGSASYWLEYGQTDAAAALSNPANVFWFYDDFTQGPLTGHWIVAGAPMLGNGSVTLRAWDPDASADPDSLTTNYQMDNVPVASALEIDATVTNPNSPADKTNGFWYWLGFQHQGDFSPSEPWTLWIQRTQNQAQPEQTTSASCQSATCVGPVVPLDTQAHVYGIERAPSATRFTFDGKLDYTITDPNTVDYSLMLRNWAQTSSVVVTLVRDRPLVDNEPTVTVGPEQVVP